MNGFRFAFTSIAKLPREFIAAIVLLLRSILGLLARWWRFILALLKRQEGEEGYVKHKCLDVPPDVARRPDPCLYSQKYLAAQSIAVTWDNPDIVVTESDGIPASLPLEPDHDYLVKGTIHNASFDPALGVAVRCFVRSWGVDFDDRIPVEVDGTGQPAQRTVHIGAWSQSEAVFKWRTPTSDGHYCLTVECFHPADREPGNNVGQENTDVRCKAAAGSKLTVIVPFFNRDKRGRSFRIVADEYVVPSDDVEVRLERLKSAGEVGPKDLRAMTAHLQLPNETPEDKEIIRRIVEQDAMRGARIRLLDEKKKGVGYGVFAYNGLQTIQARNPAGGFPIGDGWAATFPGLGEGGEVQIPGSTTHDLEVAIAVPDTAKPGDLKRINVTALDAAGRVVGGVTLDIEAEV
jgi:hypothetical protein